MTESRLSFLGDTLPERSLRLLDATDSVHEETAALPEMARKGAQIKTLIYESHKGEDMEEERAPLR